MVYATPAYFVLSSLYHRKKLISNTNRQKEQRHHLTVNFAYGIAYKLKMHPYSTENLCEYI